MVGFGDFRYSHSLAEFDYKNVHFRHPSDPNRPEQYVLLANLAPLAIRRAAFLELGGFDESMMVGGWGGGWAASEPN